MPVTTTTEIPSAISQYYDRRLLERAVALFLHGKYGQIRDIPRNNSLGIRFRRYGALSAATTALTAGTTPAGSSLAITDITATVLQYGDFVELSDELLFSTLDPVLMEAAEVLGEQAGNTLDILARNVLVAGTTIQYASTATSRATVGVAMLFDQTEAREAVRTLKLANAPKITSMVEASTGYNTSPLDACYVGICHPSTTYNLKAATGWIPVEEYASVRSIMPGEVGALDEIRFVETSNARYWEAAGASSADVYGTLVLGARAYGITRISGEALRNIIKPLGSAGTADPLDQRSTSGWKATFVATILQQAFMLRVEHGNGAGAPIS